VGDQGLERIQKSDPVIAQGKLLKVMPEKLENLVATTDKTLDILFKEASPEIAVKVKTVAEQTDQFNRIIFGDREILGNNGIIIIIKPDIFIGNILDLFLY
jgi:hypothetical protein